MKTPPIASAEEWEPARQALLVEEKAFTRARDALAAKRRRTLGMAVTKNYEFEGPKGRASRLNLSDGRRHLSISATHECAAPATSKLGPRVSGDGRASSLSSRPDCYRRAETRAAA